MSQVLEKRDFYAMEVSIPFSSLIFEEVMDGDPNVCKEYTRDGFHVSNFPLTFALVSAFGWGGDIRKAMDPHFHQLFGSVSIAGA